MRAQRGRTLLPSDEVAPGRHPVVVISDGLWRREFGADPDIVGKTVEINNHPLTVVGVADPAFHGTIVSYDVEVFIPVMMAPEIGFTLGSQQTTPSDILADRRAAVFYPARLPAAGRHARRRPPPQTEALWADAVARPAARQMPRCGCRVVPFWRSPGGAQTLRPAGADRAERDGAAGAADRVREHRRAGPGARRVAARRNRRASGARRDRGRGSSACWWSRTSCSPCLAPCSACCSRGARSRCWSPMPSGWPRRSGCSSISRSTAWSSASPPWSPACARSSSDSFRRCRARGSILCR